MKCSKCFLNNVSIHAVNRTIKTRGATSANNLFDIFEQIVDSLGKIADSVDRDYPREFEVEIDVVMRGKERNPKKVEGSL